MSQKLELTISLNEHRCLIKPYYDPEIIAEQGSIMGELIQDMSARGMTLAAILVCCGGGLFAAGIASAAVYQKNYSYIT
tara:strand:- start:31 stop:267 length:237 start_codon:yes stop_codon:yes gene_type:complete